MKKMRIGVGEKGRGDFAGFRELHWFWGEGGLIGFLTRMVYGFEFKLAGSGVRECAQVNRLVCARTV